MWAACLSPLVWGLHRLFLGDGFGVDPVQEIEHFTGDVTIITVLAALAVTPVRGLTGWNVLQKLRRPIGLFAFFWVCVHFLMWIGLDQFFAWGYIGEDLTERPFIVVGFAAFLLLLPMAVTSTRGWIRRLGKNWTRLHRGIYLASLLGIIHFFWGTKADDRLPTVALIVWMALMAFRVPWRRLAAARSARGSRTEPTSFPSAAPSAEVGRPGRKRTA